MLNVSRRLGTQNINYTWNKTMMHNFSNDELGSFNGSVNHQLKVPVLYTFKVWIIIKIEKNSKKVHESFLRAFQKLFQFRKSILQMPTLVVYFPEPVECRSTYFDTSYSSGHIFIKFPLNLICKLGHKVDPLSISSPHLEIQSFFNSNESCSTVFLG